MKAARELQRRYNAVGGPTLAGGVTLYGFLAMFALLVLGVAALGYLSAGDRNLAGDLTRDLGLTGQAARLVTESVEAAQDSRRLTTVFGVIGIVWLGSSFALVVAQLLFAVGFSLHAGTLAEHAIGVAIVAALALPLCRRFVGALRSAGRSELVIPVVVYLVAIGAMAATAIASGNGVAIAGALLFMASDALIAETRFVRDHRSGRMAIMVTYHAALAGLVLSLV